MAARVTKEKFARWQVIVPWQRGGQLSDVVAVDIAAGADGIKIKMLGGDRGLTFPLERAKLLLVALQDAIATMEAP